MNFLQIVQLLHREAKLAGTAPSAVTGQTGRNADLVAWVSQAYVDIQNEKDGKWKWLRRRFNFNTTAEDGDYAYGAITDTVAAAVIARFRAWDLDYREPPLIYLTSAGVSTQRTLTVVPWFSFRSLYLIGSPTSSYPAGISTDEEDTLHLGPKPDAIYTVNGKYWRGPQVLAADGDTPEMPSSFHPLIAYTALTKYAYNVVARELLTRAASEGTRMFTSLSEAQAWSRASFTTGGPLA